MAQRTPQKTRISEAEFHQRIKLEEDQKPVVQELFREYAIYKEVKATLDSFLKGAMADVLKRPSKDAEKRQKDAIEDLDLDVQKIFVWLKDQPKDQLLKDLLDKKDPLRRHAYFTHPRRQPEKTWFMGKKWAAYVNTWENARVDLMDRLDRETKALKKSVTEKSKKDTDALKTMTRLYVSLTDALSGQKWDTIEGYIHLENILRSKDWRALTMDQRIALLTAPTDRRETLLEELLERSPKGREKSLFAEALDLIAFDESPNMQLAAKRDVMAIVKQKASPELKDFFQQKKSELSRQLAALKPKKQAGATASENPPASSAVVDSGSSGGNNHVMFGDTTHGPNDRDSLIFDAFGALSGGDEGSSGGGHDGGAPSSCSSGGSDSSCGGGGCGGGDLRVSLDDGYIAGAVVKDQPTYHAIVEMTAVSNILSIPDLHRMVQEWPSLDHEQRRDILQQVSDAYMAAHQLSTVPVSLFNEASTAGAIRRGTVSGNTSGIRLNVHPLARMDEFAVALNSVIHEANHAVDICHRAEYLAGRTPEGQPWVKHIQALANQGAEDYHRRSGEIQARAAAETITAVILEMLDRKVVASIAPAKTLTRHLVA